MTTEQKARAYDESLERARDYYKANLKLDKEDENLILEDIFPELAELKGERIMIKEAYCSYEIAKLLKEKGFDEPCTSYFWSEENGADIDYSDIPFTNKQLYSEQTLRPTHQMAMAWLREVYKLHISIDVYPIYGKVKDEKGRNTCGLLYWLYIASGEWMNDKYNPQQKAFVVSEKSHKNAVEAALKYSLENLI